MTSLRDLPSVDRLLRSEKLQDVIALYGRPLTLQAVRQTLEDSRAGYTDNGIIPSETELIAQIERVLSDWTAPTLQAVINATGVILQTNLGRAPLSHAALQAIENISSGYSTLEYDLAGGRRGSRLVHAEALLGRLTGADAALVVNNNAAAVLLVLTALARRRKVVIGRSQLVEIGGGFRVPDIIRSTGAKLLEIGTTNRVHLTDYDLALEESPALFLRAHRSNFQIVGFTSEPSLEEIASLAHRAGIPLVDDLGSGSLLDTAEFGLVHEPMVQESLASGADLVCFSGDKLLGGPQAGIIVGRKELVAKLKAHPLARAIRPDKLCLAALTATLLHYLKDEALQEIPVWQMISMPIDQILERASKWRDSLEIGEIIHGESTIGGGSLPGETLPTYLFALQVHNPNRILKQLRINSQPPIIARMENERILFDPRTVLKEQDTALLTGLKDVLNST